jgi:cytidine deaminase
MSEDKVVKSVNHKGDEKQWTVKQLLPDAFTPKDLS